LPFEQVLLFFPELLEPLNRQIKQAIQFLVLAARGVQPVAEPDFAPSTDLGFGIDFPVG
jgi:hypothetical protein